MFFLLDSIKVFENKNLSAFGFQAFVTFSRQKRGFCASLTPERIPQQEKDERHSAGNTATGPSFTQ